MDLNLLGSVVFIGAGKMATAIAAGLVSKGFPVGRIGAFDVSPEASEHFAKTTGARTHLSAASALADADVVVLAVKPQHVAACLSEVGGALSGKLLVSIVAGMRIQRLEELSGCSRVVRTMPNTPALLCEGVTAVSPGAGASRQDAAVAMTLMSSVGRARILPENILDAVTGLSGSGPAYVFDMIQAMADGGVHQGMHRADALEFAAATVAGAARMVLEGGRHPCQLRDDVTSPGGTTSRGLAVLESGGFRGLVARAVEAAAERSRELGKA